MTLGVKRFRDPAFTAMISDCIGTIRADRPAQGA
jgi:hypothetical protein